jgi:hypothetical protein
MIQKKPGKILDECKFLYKVENQSMFNGGGFTTYYFEEITTGIRWKAHVDNLKKMKNYSSLIEGELYGLITMIYKGVENIDATIVPFPCNFQH